MSTRSLTIFYNTYEEKDTPLCAFYRQSDGYLSGHGEELKLKFGTFGISNGISMNQPANSANGMDCLAAQMIAYFKNQFGIGGIYMANVKNYQAYNYHLYEREHKIRGCNMIWVKVKDYGNKKLLFEGWLYDLPTDELE